MTTARQTYFSFTMDVYEELYSTICSAVGDLNNLKSFYHYMIPLTLREEFLLFLSIQSDISLINIQARCDEQQNNESIGVTVVKHFHIIVKSQYYNKPSQEAVRCRWRRYAKQRQLNRQGRQWYQSRNLVSVAHLSHTIIYIQTEETKGMRAPEVENEPWKLQCVGHSEQVLPTFANKLEAGKWKKQILWKRQPAIRVIAEKEWDDFQKHRKQRSDFIKTKLGIENPIIPK